MKTTTLADVARHAGVSAQTVSRVVNGRGEASEATRRRIMEAVEQLGYRPNGIARGLRSRETRTVGVLVPDITNPFFPEIVHGIEAEAMAAGYVILLCNVGEGGARETEMLHLLEERRVDGVVACSPRLDDQALAAAVRRQRAAVVINRTMDAAIAGVIRVDYDLAARGAVLHLLSRGRRRIGMISASATSRGGQERLGGFLAVAEEQGLDYLPTAVQEAVPTVEGGRDAAARLIADRPDIDGLFCYNDLTAVGALLALKEAKRRVPQDVAVVGCDDISFAGLFSPPLTTFRVDKTDIGTHAMRLLLDRMGGKLYQPQVVFQPRLIVRDSAP
jgi:LacI family transcriptional regulator